MGTPAIELRESTPPFRAAVMIWVERGQVANSRCRCTSWWRDPWSQSRGALSRERTQGEQPVSASQSLQRPDPWSQQQVSGDKPGHQASDLQLPRASRCPSSGPRQWREPAPAPSFPLAEPDRWFNNTGCWLTSWPLSQLRLSPPPAVAQGSCLRLQQDPWTAPR